jgi:hypothetical protein
MTDYEKMLREGPRVAPEPRSAEPIEWAGARQATAPAEGRPAPGRPSGWSLRLAPLGIAVVFFAVSVLGAGRYIELLLVAVAVAAVLARLVRRARG